MINKNIIFCLEYFLLIFLVGCTAFKNVPGEEYQYEQLSETPGIDAYQAIETICSPEDAALWKKTSTKKLNYGGMQPKRKCSSVEEKKK